MTEQMKSELPKPTWPYTFDGTLLQVYSPDSQGGGDVGAYAELELWENQGTKTAYAIVIQSFVRGGGSQILSRLFDTLGIDVVAGDVDTVEGWQFVEKHWTQVPGDGLGAFGTWLCANPWLPAEQREALIAKELA